MARRARKIDNLKVSHKDKISNIISSTTEENLITNLNKICDIYELGNKDLAREAIEEINSMFSNNPIILALLSKIYWKEANYKKAIEYIARAFNIDASEETKEPIRTFYSMAIHMNMAEYFENTLEINVKNKEHLKRAFSEFYTSTGDYLRAREELENLINSGSHALANYNNLALAYQMTGESKKALELYNLVLREEPDNSLAKWNYTFIDFATFGNVNIKTLEYYEEGLKIDKRSYLHNFKKPMWDGSNIKGKKLLIREEQGIGDQIRFFGYIEQLSHLFDDCTLECPAKLKPLFERSAPNIKVAISEHYTTRMHTDSCRDDLDYHCPMGTLRKHAFIESGNKHMLPSKFIIADEDKKSYWKEKIDSVTKKNTLKVGICWISGLMTLKRKHLYPSPELWGKLLKTEGATFFNANYAKDSQAQLDKWEQETGVKVHNFPELDQKDDLDSTAAYLSNMDLIISVGTAVDELAAALGINVWKILNLSAQPDCKMRRYNFDLPNSYRIQKRFDQEWNVAIDIAQKHLEKYIKTKTYPIIAEEEYTGLLSDKEKTDKLNQETKSAIDLYNNGHIAEAINKLKNIGDQKHIRATVELAKIYWNIGQIDNAIHELCKAYNTQPNMALTIDTFKIFYDKSSAQNLTNTIDKIVDENTKSQYILRHELCKHFMDKYLFDQAISQIDYLIKNGDKSPETQATLGTVYESIGETSKALELYEKALLENPDTKNLKWNIAVAKINQLGEINKRALDFYEEGFASNTRTPLRVFSKPKWNGEEDKKATLLLHGEQGIGDVLHFLYYVAPIKNMVGKIIFEDHRAKLIELLKNSYPEIESRLIDASKFNEDIHRDDFDYYLPIGTARKIIYEKQLENKLISNFIKPDLQKKSYWKEKIEQISESNIKIAICVKSIIKDKRDLEHPDLYHWQTIMPIEGITFFNATYSTEVWQELDSIANKEKTLVHNFPELDQKDDLVATAAYLSNMDLVITIGTAVGELAAALGTNVIRTTNLAQSSKCELKKHGYDLPNTYRLEKKYNQDWTVIFNKLKLILEEYKDTGKIPYPKD